MPTIHSLKGPFKADTTYRFHCEYCGREYSVTTTFDKEVSVWGVTGTPSTEQLVAAAQEEFKWHQDHARSLWDKGQFDFDRRLAKCPSCGFLPTYVSGRRQAVFNIILLLIIGAGVIIPFVVSGVAMPISMLILFGLVLLVPYLLVMWLWVRRMNPNRKLMRALRNEGRSLASPQKAQLVFGPVEHK